MTDSRVAPSIFSRILLIVAVVAALVAGYWLVSQALEPVPLPPAPLTKPAVRFDTKADVSKHPVFTQLEPIGPAAVDAGTLGRQNPFVPIQSATPTRATSSTMTR